MRIVLTGGGTGGHMMPLIAVIKELKTKRPNAELLYIGSGNELETSLATEHSLNYTAIRTGKWRRYFSFQNIIDVSINIPIGTIQSIGKLWKYMPDLVVSKGGYVALPVIMAARILRIPVLVHESDIIPGKANKIGMNFAKVIALSFEKTKEYLKESIKTGIVITGNPIRSEVRQGTEEEGRKLFEINDEAPVLIIMGGSQGASGLNKAITNALPALTQRMHIVHITGKGKHKDLEEDITLLADQIIVEHYHQYEYIDKNIGHLYAAANLIVTRAGSGSLNEIASVGLPSIIVPLSTSAHDHQRLNAYYYAENGAGVVLEEGNVKEHILIKTIEELLGDPKQYQKMSETALKLAEPNAAENVADLAINIIETP